MNHNIHATIILEASADANLSGARGMCDRTLDPTKAETIRMRDVEEMTPSASLEPGP
jgi:hypothetical protein